MNRDVRSVACWGVLLGLLTMGMPLHAQQHQPATSPSQPGDSPQNTTATPQNAHTNGDKEKQPPANDRLFSVLPNYFTVEGTNEVPPLTAGQKFKITAESAFDPYEFGVVALLAGFNQWENEDPSFGQGALGYAKRYGVGFADQAIGNFAVGAVFPVILHEEPRYFQLGKGGFWKRFNHALARTFVTPTDSGDKEFNYSEFVGNGVAAGLSNLYIPRSDRTLANTGTTWGEQIAIDMMGFEVKEFWPDIRRKIFRSKKA